MTEGERGNVSVLMAAVLAFAALLAFGVTRVGVALDARARAETAADASALAAADSLALGDSEADARGAARDAARVNDARLVSCACAGSRAEVVVEVDAGLLGTARGRAAAAVEFTR